MPARMMIAVLLLSAMSTLAADVPIVITGPTQVDQLPRAKGVENIEIFRASRESPQTSDGKGWTYHHHVDMGCWKGRLYVAWNSCEKDEDVWPSRELYSTSSDGRKWSEPAELFPQGVSTAQRMYFFQAPNGRMLAIAGLRTSTDAVAEAKKGGMVVREIAADHSLGRVFTLRSPPELDVPVPASFRDSPDKEFVAAGEVLLANKPFLEQQDYGTLLGDRRMKWHDLNTWPADEPSREHFPNRFGKAISFFHRRDGALVGVMKWGWVIVSHDEGETWSAPVRPPTLVAGMAKTWGQRTADGRYALVYNPDLLNRYPLVAVSGDDGITFGTMRIVNGEVPPLRYPGLHKVVGPQYVRGISEWAGDGSWKDEALWVAYSMGKEDIGVSRIPLPIE